MPQRYMRSYGILTLYVTVRHQKQFEEIVEGHQTARRKFYPTIPTPAIPQSLPLKSYTGIYYDPGYHQMAVTISEDNKLYILRSTETWKIKITLDHISGDFFMAYIDSATAPGLVFKKAVPAEFKIGADGISKSFGILLEEAMGSEKKIWFNRMS